MPSSSITHTLVHPASNKNNHRRLIGRRFDDPTVKKDMESWPFKVVDDEGNPKVEVQYLGEAKQFSPQEISAMVLTKVRNPQEKGTPINWSKLHEH